MTSGLFLGHRLTVNPSASSFRALFQTPMKTFSAKANEVDRKWWLIDAKNQVLGRVAVKAAKLLRGKEKTIFTPHVDTGDFVVVINADKVRVSAKKFHELFWLRRRAQIGKRARTSCAASRITDRASSARYDSAQPARPLGLSKAQGLSRRIASAQRAAATIGQARLTNFYGSSAGIHRHWSSKNFRRAHSHDSGDRQDRHQRPQFRGLLSERAAAERGSSAIASREDGQHLRSFY